MIKNGAFHFFPYTTMNFPVLLDRGDFDNVSDKQALQSSELLLNGSHFRNNWIQEKLIRFRCRYSMSRHARPMVSESTT